MTVLWNWRPRGALGLGVGLAIAGLLAMMFCASAFAAGEYEPNDDRASSAGPLKGGKWYSATFETENDVDWYLFYVKTYSQLDFSAEMTKSCGYNAYIRLLDLDGEFVDSFTAGDVSQTRHMLRTLTAGRYYLEIDYSRNCPKDTYKFRIDPATALTTSRECGEAIVAKDAVGPLLAKVSEEVGESNAALATANASTGEARATLLRLNTRWAKFQAKWNKAVKKLNRKRSWSGFLKRHKRRRLIATKRRVNRRLQAAKGPAKRELVEAKEARAEVAQERGGLLTLQAQHTATVTQADAQIAVHC
jgi:hypothetical protein